jgi:hypothetical protein
MHRELRTGQKSSLESKAGVSFRGLGRSTGKGLERVKRRELLSRLLGSDHEPPVVLHTLSNDRVSNLSIVQIRNLYLRGFAYAWDLFVGEEIVS